MNAPTLERAQPGMGASYGAAPSPEPSQRTLPGFGPIYELIEGWIEQGYFAGAALQVARRDAILAERTFGSSTPDTVEYLASAGKWLAAATILSVVDSGEMSLDDRASKWLPAWRDTKGCATVRQMLAHTSGYPAYQPAHREKDRYQTLVESVAQLAPLPAESFPGTQWNYGGLAMQVAGHIAELATGRDWESLFQERIAAPLGMTNTHFTPVDESHGHNPMLGGGARGTVGDYGRFLAMLSRRGEGPQQRVLSEAAVELIEANQVGRATLPSDNFVSAVRPGAHRGIYGLGVWREEESAQREAALVSSPGWAGTYPWIDRQHGIYGVFLAHIRPDADPQFNPMTATAALPLLVRRLLVSQR